MSQDDQVRQFLIAKFKPFIARAGGGIFTRKTRERLLGVRIVSGRDRTKNQFWYDVRNKVKNALVDMELFINMADKEQINQVLTRASLEPALRELLSYTHYKEKKPDLNRAEIADLFIFLGFQYLKEEAKGNITLSHERTISEAVDLSDYLLHTIKGERYYTPSEAFGMRGRI